MIEVMLVLGISGLMLVGIMTNVFSSIRAQKYNDSVNNLTDYFQGIYSKLVAVENITDNNLRCGSSGMTEAMPNSSNPGQSDCLIMGVFLSSDGSSITSKTVYSTNDLAKDAPDDLEALKRANLVEDVNSKNFVNYKLSWETSIYSPSNLGTNTKMHFNMAVLRSPLSGTIYTFFNDSGNTSNVSSMLDNSYRKEALLCVGTNGFLGGNGKMGVRIKEDAVNASGVSLITEAEEICQ